MSNRVDKIYFCAVCGNEVRFEKDGGGRLVCCGQEMKEQTEDEE
jgi:desulfoferrodoxin-like iron-binding protein